MPKKMLICGNKNSPWNRYKALLYFFYKEILHISGTNYLAYQILELLELVFYEIGIDKLCKNKYQKAEGKCN